MPDFLRDAQARSFDLVVQLHEERRDHESARGAARRRRVPPASIVRWRAGAPTRRRSCTSPTAARSRCGCCGCPSASACRSTARSSSSRSPTRIAPSSRSRGRARRTRRRHAARGARRGAGRRPGSPRSADALAERGLRVVLSRLRGRGAVTAEVAAAMSSPATRPRRAGRSWAPSARWSRGRRLLVTNDTGRVAHRRRAARAERRRLHDLRPAPLGAARRRAAPLVSAPVIRPELGAGRGGAAARRMRPVALVDARNVLRSRWPNIREDALCAASSGGPRTRASTRDRASTARPRGRDARPPRRQRQADRRRLDHNRGRPAEREGTPYWLITSDRELRERAGGAAARIIGGGNRRQPPQEEPERRAGGGAAAARPSSPRSFFLRWRSSSSAGSAGPRALCETAGSSDIAASRRASMRSTLFSTFGLLLDEAAEACAVARKAHRRRRRPVAVRGMSSMIEISLMSRRRRSCRANRRRARPRSDRP